NSADQDESVSVSGASGNRHARAASAYFEGRTALKTTERHPGGRRAKGTLSMAKTDLPIRRHHHSRSRLLEHAQRRADTFPDSIVDRGRGWVQECERNQYRSPRMESSPQWT